MGNVVSGITATSTQNRHWGHLTVPKDRDGHPRHRDHILSSSSDGERAPSTHRALGQGQHTHIIHVLFLFHRNHSNFRFCKGAVSTLHIRGNGGSEKLSRTITVMELGLEVPASAKIHLFALCARAHGSPAGTEQWKCGRLPLGPCPGRASSEAEASLPHSQPLSARPWTHGDVVSTNCRGYWDWAETRQASDREPTPFRDRKKPKSSFGIIWGN